MEFAFDENVIILTKQTLLTVFENNFKVNKNLNLLFSRQAN